MEWIIGIPAFIAIVLILLMIVVSGLTSLVFMWTFILLVPIAIGKFVLNFFLILYELCCYTIEKFKDYVNKINV